MKITSTAFENNSNIPSKYTCDGEGINPSLLFIEVPPAAQSLVLISDDPDAPGGTFVHWTVWNINPQTTEIAENSVPFGAIQGITSYGKKGYGSPCPPSGIHRYYFKLYALDSTLDLPVTADANQLETAIQGHVINSAELIGLYSRV